VKFYNAGSSEAFGNTAEPANEETPFRPRSPYATAKAAAHYAVNNYREAYGIFACSGILFNHESPLRPERFVTAKVIASAVRIAEGSGERLKLGRLDIQRDWGWAPEYVDAMWRMLQRDRPDDFVVATGERHSLEDFVSETFRRLGLDWRDHVETDPSLRRPTDLECNCGDASKAQELLGWIPRLRFSETIVALLEARKRGA
jgi:GDPmannose 4,6-dehydratase